MAYIPTTIIGKTRENKKIAALPLPVNGINLKAHWQSSDLSKCVAMKNLVPHNLGIKCRGSFEQIEGSSIQDEGSFHSITCRPYCERIVMHYGNKIYTFCDGESNWQVLYEGVPDKDSMFCEFSSKLYLYSDTYVFSVDRSFNCIEEYPKAPIYMESLNTQVATGLKTDNFHPNLLAPRISVVYDESSESAFALPENRDVNRKVKAFADGEELEVNEEKCTKKWVHLKKSVDDKVVTIEYYLEDPQIIKFNNLFSGCRECIAYGGTDAGGTRIFAGGNRQRPGEYCKSELIDPLCFYDNSIEKLGDGCDIITGFAKMYDSLLIFTDRSIYRMSYKLVDTGGFFSVKQITSNVGCDVPKSIQLVENRVVFANSAYGIHIVYYADETGELNVLPISGNVNDGVDGILTCDTELLKNGFSLDYDNKYYFCTAEKIYIWDYGMCGFTRSSSYENSQGRLVWYIWDNLEGDMLVSMNRKLYCIKSSNALVTKYNADNNHDECSFVTEKYDLGRPLIQKRIVGMKLDMSLSQGSEVILTLYNGDKPYFSQSIYSGKDEDVCVDIKLPEMKLYRFGYGLSTQNGLFELKGAAVKLIYAAD
ncbi:MAG: hypothetical protein J6K12_06170 [Clostridia bacterium]|nr:hypothetical protein [Clostridia bacterium]